MGFGAAFKLQVSLSCSISLTCLNCGLIESKTVFRKCSSGHVCTGSQSTNGTPRRHCAGHSPSCLGALGKELRRCTLRLFPVCVPVLNGWPRHVGAVNSGELNAADVKIPSPPVASMLASHYRANWAIISVQMARNSILPGAGRASSVSAPC